MWAYYNGMIECKQEQVFFLNILFHYNIFPLNLFACYTNKEWKIIMFFFWFVTFSISTLICGVVVPKKFWIMNYQFLQSWLIFRLKIYFERWKRKKLTSNYSHYFDVSIIFYSRLHVPRSSRVPLRIVILNLRSYFRYPIMELFHKIQKLYILNQPFAIVNVLKEELTNNQLKQNE